MLKPNKCAGKLIVVEGIDGSGKSTQIDLIFKWLTEKGKSVYFSEWNSSPLVKSTTKLGKKKKAFTPTTFSLIQAADFADRWENQILPMLKAGVIVLADRYAYTGFARDVVRGVDRKWVRNLYSFAFQPDLILYFKVPLEDAIDRISSSRSKLKYYEAGMDLNLSDKRINSFRLFQEKILEEYEKMIDEFGFEVLDATRPVHKQQKDIRKLVLNALKGWRGLPNPVVSARNYARHQTRGNSTSQTEGKNGTR